MTEAASQPADSASYAPSPVAPPVGGARASVLAGMGVDEGSALVRRILGALVAGGASAVLGLAAWLEPASEGLGTHEQLSMPACGWITLMDLPCPTCGMTTAFAHAANGSFLASFAAQPLGFLLALATAMALLVGAYVALTGSPVARELGRLWGRRTGWLLTGVLLVAWAYKVVAYRGGL